MSSHDNSDGSSPIPPRRFDSTDATRTRNNFARHTYRTLSDDEKKAIHFVKDAAVMLAEYIDRMTPKSGLTPPAGTPSCDPRCAALAKTKIEEAVMWAVKGITG